MPFGPAKATFLIRLCRVTVDARLAYNLAPEYEVWIMEGHFPMLADLSMRMQLYAMPKRDLRPMPRRDSVRRAGRVQEPFMHAASIL